MILTASAYFCRRIVNTVPKGIIRNNRPNLLDNCLIRTTRTYSKYRINIRMLCTKVFEEMVAIITRFSFFISNQPNILLQIRSTKSRDI